MAVQEPVYSVGRKYEGKDVYGDWRLITLTSQNYDGTFQAVVHDGYNTCWRRVHKANLRVQRSMRGLLPTPKTHDLAKNWICPTCNNVNFPNRTFCNNKPCGAQRPATGNDQFKYWDKDQTDIPRLQMEQQNTIGHGTPSTSPHSERTERSNSFYGTEEWQHQHHQYMMQNVCGYTSPSPFYGYHYGYSHVQRRGIPMQPNPDVYANQVPSFNHQHGDNVSQFNYPKFSQNVEFAGFQSQNPLSLEGFQCQNNATENNVDAHQDQIFADRSISSTNATTSPSSIPELVPEESTAQEESASSSHDVTEMATAPEPEETYNPQERQDESRTISKDSAKSLSIQVDDIDDMLDLQSPVPASPTHSQGSCVPSFGNERFDETPSLSEQSSPTHALVMQMLGSPQRKSGCGFLPPTPNCVSEQTSPTHCFVGSPMNPMNPGLIIPSNQSSPNHRQQFPMPLQGMGMPGFVPGTPVNGCLIPLMMNGQSPTHAVQFSHPPSPMKNQENPCIMNPSQPTSPNRDRPSLAVNVPETPKSVAMSSPTRPHPSFFVSPMVSPLPQSPIRLVEDEFYPQVFPREECVEESQTNCTSPVSMPRSLLEEPRISNLLNPMHEMPDPIEGPAPQEADEHTPDNVECTEISFVKRVGAALNLLPDVEQEQDEEWNEDQYDEWITGRKGEKGKGKGKNNKYLSYEEQYYNYKYGSKFNGFTNKYNTTTNQSFGGKGQFISKFSNGEKGYWNNYEEYGANNWYEKGEDMNAYDYSGNLNPSLSWRRVKRDEADNTSTAVNSAEDMASLEENQELYGRNRRYDFYHKKKPPVIYSEATIQALRGKGHPLMQTYADDPKNVIIAWQKLQAKDRKKCLEDLLDIGITVTDYQQGEAILAVFEAILKHGVKKQWLKHLNRILINIPPMNRRILWKKLIMLIDEF